VVVVSVNVVKVVIVVVVLLEYGVEVSVKSLSK